MSDTVRFQHFEVLRKEDGSLFELGRGAMGITYKAFDTNLRAFVALKVINGAYLNSEVARQRFLREARAAAALRHPNVATVFHLGSEDDSYFYAMEFVDGETVEGFMKREGAVPPIMALEISLQVARALIAAERQGLVHRDIKPSNLMLVREDESEFTVKVIDFGLAKSSAKEDGEDSATLTSGGFLGTPHFASPEQLDERPIDTRSDIYSLGVTLWYMLAGKTPFSGSLAQVMSQHLHREPPFENLEGQIPAVVTLLRRMMAKAAEDRPQTPLALRKEIEASLEAVKAARPAGPATPAVDDECFETAILPDPLDATRSTFSSGQILAGRFKLVDEIVASDHGRMFRAQSLEDNQQVAVLLLHSEKLSTSQAFTQLEEEVDTLQKLPSLAFQRVLSLERADFQSFLVLEWVEGPTLLEILRTRRALSLPEASRILTPLSAAFDELQGAGLSCPDIAVHEVHLPTANASQPVNEWPQCVPKFLAITQTGSSSLPVDATMVASSFAMMKAHGAFAGNPPSAFVFGVASLAFEMLGGVKGETSTGTYIPIAGVSEEGNAVLRKALNPAQSYPSARDFVQALSQAKSLPSAPIKPSNVPAPTTPRPPASTPAPAKAPDQPPALPPKAPPVESATLVKAKKSTIPILAASGGALLLVVVLGVWLSSRQKASTEPSSPAANVAQVDPTPAATVPAATPEQPVPSPTATPLTPFQTELAAAEALQQKDDFAGAISAFSDLVTKYPDEPLAKEKLKIVVDGLQTRFDKLSSEEKSTLEEPLKKAANVGITYAQLMLGLILQPINPGESLKWFQEAGRGGQSEAMVQVGLMLSNGDGVAAPDLPEAVVWFTKAADLNDPLGMYSLAECYNKGQGVERNPRRALELLTTASALNNTRALNMLGDMNRKGVDGLLERNPVEAMRLYTRAMELGSADSYGYMGILYFSGEGVIRDDRKGEQLFREGAEKGSPFCMFLYAKAVEEKSPATAREWYIRSAKAGNRAAIKWCRENNVSLTNSP